MSIIGFCDTVYFGCLCDGEGGALQVFAAAGVTDKHFEFARLNDSVSFRIDDGAIGNRNIEGNGLAFARFEFHALECFEFTIRPAIGGHDVADVELHYFRALAIARIGEGDFGMHGVGFGEHAGFRNIGDGRLSVFERGVAQAFAECECRILREVGVTVAVLAANLVIVDRQLACVTREVIGSRPLGSVSPRMISAMA